MERLFSSQQNCDQKESIFGLQLFPVHIVGTNVDPKESGNIKKSEK